MTFKESLRSDLKKIVSVGIPVLAFAIAYVVSKGNFAEKPLMPQYEAQREAFAKIRSSYWAGVHIPAMCGIKYSVLKEEADDVAKKYRDRNEEPLEVVKSVMDAQVMKIGGAEEVRHFHSVFEAGLKIATPRMEKEAQPFMTSQGDCSRVMSNIRDGSLDFMTINKREVAIIWGSTERRH